jgi:hypothetical protein
VLHSTAGELPSSVVVIPQISSPITVVRGSAISEFDRPLRRAWLAASLVWCVVLVASGLRVTQRRRQWHASVVDGVPVLISRDVGPAVVGVIRPQIVIPPWVLTLAPQQRTLVLAHEQEHARARDPLLLAAGALTLVAMPWNAALWYALSRLRLAVEADCDGRVLHTHPDTRAYSSLLVDVTERNLTHTLHLAALGASRSQLARRLALVTARTPRHLAARVLSATLFSLTCVVGACKTPQPAVVSQDLGIRSGSRAEATARTARSVASSYSSAVDRASTSEPQAVGRFAKDSSALNAAHVPNSARQGALSAFSLVITTIPTGWAAHCDSGCRWQEVAYSCPGNCKAVFDANGVSTPRARRADASGFAFELQRVDGETRARSLAGTAWKALSWGCPTDTCRARIDANGVHGVRTGAAADSVATGWIRSQPPPAVDEPPAVPVEVIRQAVQTHYPTAFSGALGGGRHYYWFLGDRTNHVLGFASGREGLGVDEMVILHRGQPPERSTRDAITWGSVVRLVPGTPPSMQQRGDRLQMELFPNGADTVVAVWARLWGKTSAR